MHFLKKFQLDLRRIVATVVGTPSFFRSKAPPSQALKRPAFSPDCDAVATSNVQEASFGPI